MLISKHIMIGLVIAGGVLVTPIIPQVIGMGDVPRRVGLGLTASSRTIALDGYYSVRDRGTATHIQAWAWGRPPRGVAEVRAVRLATVPNLIGNVRRNIAILRAVRIAAYAVVRHFLGGPMTAETNATQPTGERDADRG